MQDHGFSRDLGQTTPLLLIALAVAVFFCAGLARLGVASISSARAATAADAAALSGAIAGRGSAYETATRNNAQLDIVTSSGSDFEVVASVDGAYSRSRARRVSEIDTRGRSGLSTELVLAISRAEEILGESIPIVSGFRTRASQQALWDARSSNPFPVARPGTSAHETGQAIDVKLSFVPKLLQVATLSGLCHPLPIRDPIHFVLCLTPQT